MLFCLHVSVLPRPKHWSQPLPRWRACLFSYAAPSSKLSGRRSPPSRRPLIQTLRRWQILLCLPHQSYPTTVPRVPRHCWGTRTPTLCKSVCCGDGQTTSLASRNPCRLGWLGVLLGYARSSESFMSSFHRTVCPFRALGLERFKEKGNLDFYSRECGSLASWPWASCLTSLFLFLCQFGIMVVYLSHPKDGT